MVTNLHVLSVAIHELSNNNKGDVQSCSNYRGIQLTSHTMKLWERIVERRLTSELTCVVLHEKVWIGREVCENSIRYA